MLTHSEIWAAIDLLAKRNGLSSSGLAVKAGLSSTLFNPSKRFSTQRKRWPSTESIAAILEATQTPLDAFVALIRPKTVQRTGLVLYDLNELASMRKKPALTASLPNEALDTMPLPGGSDEQAFAVEISDKSYEPVFHEGDRLIVTFQEKVRRGDTIITALSSGEIVIKLLGREGAHKIELLPLKGDLPPLTLARSDLLWMGRVIWASR